MPRREISKGPYGAKEENFEEIFIRNSSTGYGTKFPETRKENIEILERK